MNSFAHIIAQFNYGNWTAWFSDSPQTMSDGDDWERAVAVLIDLHGSPHLEWSRIVPIAEKTWDGHVEFLIPYAPSSRYMMSTSVN